MELQTKARAVVVVLGVVVVGSGAYMVLNPSTAPRHIPSGDPGQDPEDRRALLETLRIDAAAIPVSRPDPSPPAGDLMAEARAFTTLDACVADRARLDPLVGDSLRAIGYDTFLRDSCRILEALQKQALTPCTEISAAPLRNHCAATVAIALAHPDDCPFASDISRTQGREPFCVAVAARDPRLCAAVPGPRVTCDAVLARSPEKCPRAGGDDCRRDVTRLRALVTGDIVKEKPLRATRITLSVHGEGQTDTPMPATAELSADAAHGLVLVRARDRHVMEVGSFGGGAYAPASLQLMSALRVSETNGGASATLERFELDLPGRTTVIFPGNRVEGKVTFDAWKPARGEPVGITFVGRVTMGSAEYTVNERVETFIRDVVTEDVPAPPPPLRALSDRDQ